MEIKTFKKFFNKKKILITGHTGFVGSNLTVVLSLFGASILGYSLKKNYKGYLSNHPNFKKLLKTITGDILKINIHKKKIIKFKPEIVIHLASQPIVGDAYNDIKGTYLTNVLGTVELFELIKKIPSVRQVLIFTSDKVYRNISGNILNEESPLGGLDPYSSSKSSQDILANSYKESYFKYTKNVTIIRAGNIIGGGDFDFTRLIPDIFLSIYKNKKIILRNPNSIRPWQHIFDLINAMLIIICKSQKKIRLNSIVFNIGPNKSSNIKVITLIRILKENLKNLRFEYKKKNIFRETKILKLSNNKIKRHYSWRPRLNIFRSLNLTNLWYKEFYKDPNKIFEFTLKQIKKYFKLL